MPTIKITRKHSLARSGARHAADLLAKELEERLGLTGLVGHWKHNTLQLSVATGPAQGTTGEVTVGGDAVRVALSLPPARIVMCKSIEVGVSQFLKKARSG